MLFEIAGTSYRVNTLDARSQFLLLNRLAPLLPALDGVGRALGRYGKVGVADALAAVSPLMTAPEADLDTIMDTCLLACEARQGDEWHSAAEHGDDLDIADTLQIVAHVVAQNFAPFFALKHPRFTRSMGRGLGFEPVGMPDGLDWLLRPALRGLCRYESLIDGALHIEHVAEMNDLLDIADENQHRAQQVADKAR